MLAAAGSVRADAKRRAGPCGRRGGARANRARAGRATDAGTTQLVAERGGGRHRGETRELGRGDRRGGDDRGDAWLVRKPSGTSEDARRARRSVKVVRGASICVRPVAPPYPRACALFRLGGRSPAPRGRRRSKYLSPCSSAPFPRQPPPRRGAHRLGFSSGAAWRDGVVCGGRRDRGGARGSGGAVPR